MQLKLIEPHQKTQMANEGSRGQVNWDLWAKFTQKFLKFNRDLRDLVGKAIFWIAVHKKRKRIVLRCNFASNTLEARTLLFNLKAKLFSTLFYAIPYTFDDFVFLFCQVVSLTSGRDL